MLGRGATRSAELPGNDRIEDEVRDYLRTTYPKIGLGYYPHAGFIHVDVGRTRAAYWVDYSRPGERAAPPGADKRTLFRKLVEFVSPGPDSRDELISTLADAEKAKLPVLVVFGANWCGDCKVLDLAFKEGASAPLIARHFKVVKVDVGKFNRNVDIAEGYGVPLKSGIPAVAVLSDQGRAVYATRAGELADARKMGDQGIHDFFVKVAAQGR